MKSSKDIEKYIKELESKFSAAMPEIHRKVAVYEEKKRTGKLTKNPVSAPQFNG